MRFKGQKKKGKAARLKEGEREGGSERERALAERDREQMCASARARELNWR